VTKISEVLIINIWLFRHWGNCCCFKSCTIYHGAGLTIEMEPDFWGANKTNPDRRTEFNIETLFSRGSNEVKQFNEESIKTEISRINLSPLPISQNMRGSFSNGNMHIKKKKA